ncbi:hypothetical protein QFZ81_000618 [Paenibacillus sp. V4I9]|uniref:hypothetical protein n=1 Tax=Paenibacillus sp. V4I9 TaxID=3042308 RepID=UPI00277DF418|nr:hypothetical protein [Paenibacillus sp. V4I9]MDQ0885530.1 hypothetical protein [Paenibacillus sp. V4I9]
MSNKFLLKVDWHIIRRLTLYWNKKHKRDQLHPRRVTESVLGAAILRWVKNIGKPYAGKLLVRFDEGGLGNQSPTL